jgi:hypothetical protein
MRKLVLISAAASASTVSGSSVMDDLQKFSGPGGLWKKVSSPRLRNLCVQ